MGLTIHYKLTTDLTKPKEIRQVVEAIRQSAFDLAVQGGRRDQGVSRRRSRP